ncbi:hypothetical protein BJ508DRAFT_417714 [Ascobolus immersus RN42]|uniref:DUF7918 domain-containing protein n=1 Tax=Ascobolus immersus RN42 TaxID=1160509 RepID=A0A3N4HW49_ASCIM|nr:hypothetical protein BJ508DRAFT_417714 [Ascobolus immersus RN42]
MVEFNGFRIAVETNDIPLPEYAYPDEEPANTKTVYIEVPPSNEPVRFKIRTTPLKPLEKDDVLGYGVSTTVDGLLSAYTRHISCERNADGTLVEGIYINTPDRTGAVLREMFFKRLETIEENDNNHEDIDPAKLGMIETQMQRYLSRRERPVGEAERLLVEQGSTLEGKISEKKIKGSSTSHSAGLGNQIRSSLPSPYSWTVGPTLLTVRFLYRSKASLQSLGIIPHDPPPPRLKREREEVIDLTGGTAGIKTELGTPIKHERRVKRRFQVVDLT